MAKTIEEVREYKRLAERKKRASLTEEEINEINRIAREGYWNRKSIRTEEDIKKQKEIQKKSKIKNKEKIKAGTERYNELNKEKNREYRRNYYQKNKELISQKKSEKINQDPEGYKNKRSVITKKYTENNKDKLVSYRKSTRDKQNKYKKNRKEQDPNFAIATRLHTSIRKAIKKSGTKKTVKSFELLGISIQAFVKYIESKFLPAMTWENRNEWHLDHIKPCAAFNLINREEQLACFNYTNFQPLWKKDNLSKGSLYEGKRHSYIKVS